ncbi:MAG TPA: CGNR zinc finger domain-containing protein [Solirubrobacteraceae bacterium]|jgi:predicted RNA-binding Zn ribbon-like protein|nr:CGNR zinc finger domain-containing protein [Solirubrobacteraceae bacterium]
MSSPPHNLQLVIDFVNTLDVETGEDRTDTPAQLAQWLGEQGLRGGDEPGLGEAELAQAIGLRESLRTVLVSHNQRDPADDKDTHHLGEVAERGLLSVCFGPGGEIEIAPRAGGYPGVLAQLLVPVTHAGMDGSWARVKACAADDCQWAFYDSSRNRSGRWCDMAVCGNREKVRTYRSRQPEERSG